MFGDSENEIQVKRKENEETNDANTINFKINIVICKMTQNYLFKQFLISYLKEKKLKMTKLNTIIST